MVQGQICDILRPQLAMNRFLPLWPHRFPHFGYFHLGGEGVGGGGGPDILDRCRAFNLFASVDAHLWVLVYRIFVSLCKVRVYRLFVQQVTFLSALHAS